ncbi:MAG: hypothetical protein HPY60_08975 [Candidatus Methanofastidiosum sp.]|nr:hypothetical protein [Methanofastidiosum sp.]
MRKILALISVLIMGIASVSIVSSQNPCLIGTTPPSDCQECMINFWCGDITDPVEKQRCIYYNSLDAFLTCQQNWFHPYWMEIYSNEVKGCYARDLLCFNAPIEPRCPSICEVICDTKECYDECCERADCYLYGGKLEPIGYPYGESQNDKMVLTIPSCNESRAFFKSPPPCGTMFETDSSVSEAQILNDTEPTCCFDMRECGNAPSLGCAVPCTGYNMPANYRCDVNEYVIMKIISGGGVLINGMPYDSCTRAPNGNSCFNWIIWYNGKKPFESAYGVMMIQGVPRTITIEGEGTLEFSLEQKCCYDCTPKPSLPSTILYPKVDIETLSIAGGPTIIQDGKILSSLTISPGVQQAMIQVENRGFFTQNDSRVRFEGLPEGVNVSVSPDSQKITAHNIGTYSATFTVGPNVPSGTYKVTLIAYSPNGVFDTMTIDFVVP